MIQSRLSSLLLGLLFASASIGVGAAELQARQVEGADQDPLLLIDEMLWTAGSLRQILADRDYPAVLLTSTLTRLLQANGGTALPPGFASVLTAASLPTGAPTLLQRCREETDPVEGTLCSLEYLIPLAPPQLARALAEDGSRLVSLYLRPGEARIGAARTALSGEIATALDPFQRFTEEALAEAWALRSSIAGRGENFSATLDGVLGGLLGFSPRDGADGVMARLPELREAIGAHALLAAFDERSRTLDEVVGEYHRFLGGVTASLGELVQRVPTAEEGVGALTLGLEARGRQAAEWATQRSLVFLATKSASFAGAHQDLSERIRTIGNAAVDLRRGADGFTANLAWRGREFAMAALSGNVLTVAASLTSFFDLFPGAMGVGATGEVRALREGVEEMRGELTGRFDQMDLRVDTLFDVLTTRFGRLETLVATNNLAVRTDIASLHEEVLALGRRFDRVEENLRSYIQAGFDRDYNRTLVRCLEHRERYLPPFDQMEFSLFSECLSDFRVRAVQDARDALFTDQTTPVDDLSLAEALSDPSFQNLAFRLSLLGRAAEQRFGYAGLHGGRSLANPVEWAMAAQAYLTLLHDWPEYARSVTPGDLDAIHSVGVQLRTALRDITLDPNPGERGTLIDRVLSYYLTGTEELITEADVLAKRHQQEGLRRVPAESLLTHLEGGVGYPRLGLPAEIAATLPQEVRTAAILALGEARLTYRLATQDSLTRENPRRRLLLFGRRHDRLTHTRVEIEVDLRFGDLGTVASYRTFSPFFLRKTEEMAGEFSSDQVVSTRDNVPDPEAFFLQSLWPSLLSDPATPRWEISPISPALHRTIESAIEEELRRHATLALNGVFANLCEIGNGGSPSTLQGVDRESSERMRRALDRMTAGRTLLEAYLRLSIPISYDSDSELRSFLFGGEALFNRDTLCSVVAQGDSPMRPVWLEEEPRRRLSGFEEVLAVALEREREYPELLPLVDATLAEIEAVARMRRLLTVVAGLPTSTP